MIKKAIILGIVTFGIVIINGCSTNNIQLDENQSYITWYDDQDKIDINIYIKSDLPHKGEFYLYLVQKDMDLANSLNYMTLPLDDGNLFTIESFEELRIIESIELPIEISMTEKKLSEAYEVTVGYLDTNEKEQQSTYQITKVKVKK